MACLRPVRLLLVFLCGLLGSGIEASAQSVLEAFNPGANEGVLAFAVQPDGKIVVGGNFTMLGGGGSGKVPRNYIGRLNADGSVDASFKPSPNDSVWAIALQPDGRILIGGNFTTITTDVQVTRNRIARLNPDGTLDTSFNAGSTGSILSIGLQADGKIVVGGSFTALRGTGDAIVAARSRIGRFNADGTLDAGFNPGVNNLVWSVAVQPDQRIVLGGEFTKAGGGGFGTMDRIRLARFESSGSLDGTFNPGANGSVTGVGFQSDGKIVVGGFFTALGGGTGTATPRRSVGRITTDGSVDPFFNPGANAIVWSLAVDADDRIVLGGDFTMAGGGGSGLNARNRLARLNADGSIDGSYNPGANGAVRRVAVQPDRRTLAGGYFTALGGATGTTPRMRIGRIRGDGLLESDPDADGLVRAVALQPDGRILIGGDFAHVGGVPRARLARLNADRSLDLTFDPGANGSVNAIVLQPDGTILVGGSFSLIGGGGEGTTGRNSIARLSGEGSVDPAFDPGANARVTAIVLQPDGKIVVGGGFTMLGGGGAGTTARWRIGRLNDDGSLDSSFPDVWPLSPPYTAGEITALALQPDGRIVLAGHFFDGHPGHVNRLNPDGSWDATFRVSPAPAAVPGPYATTVYAIGTQPYARVHAITVQPDGKILLGGNFELRSVVDASVSRFSLARLHADGSLDAAFNSPQLCLAAVDGSVCPLSGEIFTIALQTDGRFFIGGRFSELRYVSPAGTVLSSAPRFGIAAISAIGGVDTAFNPGANADVSAIAIQADGGLFIAGDFSLVGGGGAGSVPRKRLARLTNTYMAVTNLDAAHGGAIVTWSRVAAAPEVTWVVFEVSVDGTTFTPLAAPVRIPSGWRLTGADLPLNQPLQLRARGHAPPGNVNGSIFESTQSVLVVPTLALTVTRGGTVFVSTGASCDAEQQCELTVNGTATLSPSATGGVFIGWAGDADCLDGTVTVTRYTTCEARFAGLRTPVEPLGRRVMSLSGSGLGDVLLYNPATGAVRQQLTGDSGTSGTIAGQWATGWTVLAATLNSDVRSDLFLYRAATGQFIKATNVGYGQFSFYGYFWGPNWTPYIVDFNGDGLSDVFLHNAANGTWVRALAVAGQNDFAYAYGSWAPGFSVYPADLNGDGRSDLFLYNRVPAHAYAGLWFRVFTGASGEFTYEMAPARWGPNWDVYPIDFDGDGASELFLYQPANGYWVRVGFTAAGPTYAFGQWGAGFVVDTGNFVAGSARELFIYRPTDGYHFVVALNAGGAFDYYGGGRWAPGFTVRVSDFNADGISDVMLYDAATGLAFQVHTLAPGVYAYYSSTWATGFSTIVTRPD